jgi:hypothetical protein
MVNPFYVNKDVWQNQVTLIKQLTNVQGNSYKIMANTLATERALYCPLLSDYTRPRSADGNCTLTKDPKRPILFAEESLQSGDSILVEGFFVKAGKLNTNATYKILDDVQQLKPGVTWSAIMSEKSYKPPLIWKSYLDLRKGWGAPQYRSFAENPANLAYIEQLFKEWTVDDWKYGSLLPKFLFKGDSVNWNYQIKYSAAARANFLFDVNYIKAANFDHNNICHSVVEGQDDSDVEEDITAQSQGTTCLDWSRYVFCKLYNFRAGKEWFDRAGGEYLTYSEASLGLFSGVLSTCPEQ